MSKFGELINAQVPVLIDFYTDWNESSVSMHPVIKDVAAALGDKAKVIKIDVDKNQELELSRNNLTYRILLLI
jgi:thioredoxin 1